VKIVFCGQIEVYVGEGEGHGESECASGGEGPLQGGLQGLAAKVPETAGLRIDVAVAEELEGQRPIPDGGEEGGGAFAKVLGEDDHGLAAQGIHDGSVADEGQGG
jgi:hypothetical protein